MSSNVGVVNVQIKADTAQFKRDVENLGKEASNATRPLGQTLTQVGDKIDRTGRKLTTRLTLPIIGLAAATVKTFADFDDALTQSLAIQGPEVAEKFRDEMERTARSVATDLGISVTEAAESFFFLASAGLDAESQIASLPQVAAFAKAGMFDMARATDLATDAQSALGLVSDDASENLENLTRVTDVLVGANTLANASVEQFGDALTTKAGAALRTVNKDVEEGVAVLAALADQGIKGAEAGEKLNVFLRDTSRAASSNAEEFEALGLQIFDTDGNMRNLADIVENMEEVFGDMSDEQRVATMDALGLNRGVADVSRQLMGTSDSIREYEAELREMGGITEDVADRQLESFSGQMSIVKAELTDLALDIGPIVIEQFLKPLIENVRNIVERFRNMDDSTKQLIVRIAGIAAAVGPVLIVTGKLFKIVGSVIGPLAKLSGLMFRLARVIIPPLIKGVILLTKAMLANPFVLIAVAVVGLIAGLVLLYQRWEGFRNVVDSVISFVRGIIERFVSFFIGVWQGAVAAAQVAFDAIRVVIETVIGVVTAIFEAYWAYVTFVFDAIKTAVEVAFAVVQAIIEAVIATATAVFEAFQIVVETVWSAIQVAAEFVFGLIQQAWENLTGAITAAIEFARAIIEGVWNAVQSAAETAFGLIRSAWDRMAKGIENIINGAKRVIEGVWNAIKGAAETAFNFIRDRWNDVTGAIGSAIETAKGIVFGVFDSIKDRAERIFGGIKDFVTGVFDSAVDGIKSGLNTAIGLLNGLIRAANKIPFVNIPEIRPLANGAIVGSPTLALIGEAGSEAVIPLTRPRRAMELMEQSGLADMARGTGGRGGAAVNIEHATFVAPLDAEKVAQKVIVAEKARAFAA